LSYKIDDPGRILCRIEIMEGCWKDPALIRCSAAPKAAGSSFRGKLAHNRRTASERGKLAATNAVGAAKEEG